MPYRQAFVVSVTRTETTNAAAKATSRFKVSLRRVAPCARYARLPTPGIWRRERRLPERVDCAIDLLRANRTGQPGRPGRPDDGAQATQRADATLVTGDPAQTAHRTTSGPATHRKTTLLWNAA
jgi:hypothetical protein